MLSDVRVLGKVSITCDGIWNKEESYDKLSIVIHNGKSYISRKPIPKNTDITNTDYWQEFSISIYTSGYYKLPGSLDNLTTNSTDTEITNNIGTYQIISGNASNVIIDKTSVVEYYDAIGGCSFTKIIYETYKIIKRTWYISYTETSRVWTKVTNIVDEPIIVIDDKLSTVSNNAIQNDEVSKIINNIITINDE